MKKDYQNRIREMMDNRGLKWYEKDIDGRRILTLDSGERVVMYEEGLAMVQGDSELSMELARELSRIQRVDGDGIDGLCTEISDKLCEIKSITSDLHVECHKIYRGDLESLDTFRANELVCDARLRIDEVIEMAKRLSNALS